MSIVFSDEVHAHIDAGVDPTNRKLVIGTALSPHTAEFTMDTDRQKPSLSYYEQVKVVERINAIRRVSNAQSVRLDSDPIWTSAAETAISSPDVLVHRTKETVPSLAVLDDMLIDLANVTALLNPSLSKVAVSRFDSSTSGECALALRLVNKASNNFSAIPF
jgi:hypothetical protein